MVPVPPPPFPRPRVLVPAQYHQLLRHVLTFCLAGLASVAAEPGPVPRPCRHSHVVCALMKVQSQRGGAHMDGTTVEEFDGEEGACKTFIQ